MCLLSHSQGSTDGTALSQRSVWLRHLYILPSNTKQDTQLGILNSATNIQEELWEPRPDKSACFVLHTFKEHILAMMTVKQLVLHQYKCSFNSLGEAFNLIHMCLYTIQSQSLKSLCRNKKDFKGPKWCQCENNHTKTGKLPQWF